MSEIHFMIIMIINFNQVNLYTVAVNLRERYYMYTEIVIFRDIAVFYRVACNADAV